MLTYFMAEGVVCQQQLLYFSNGPDRKELADRLPAKSKKGSTQDSDSGKSAQASDTELKIAWQYKRCAAASNSNTHGVPNYLTLKVQTQLSFTPGWLAYFLAWPDRLSNPLATLAHIQTLAFPHIIIGAHIQSRAAEVSAITFELLLCPWIHPHRDSLTVRDLFELKSTCVNGEHLLQVHQALQYAEQTVQTTAVLFPPKSNNKHDSAVRQDDRLGPAV